jgi:hypothetical protein
MECDSRDTDHALTSDGVHKAYFYFRLSMAIEYAHRLGLFRILSNRPENLGKMITDLQVPSKILETICGVLHANNILCKTILAFIRYLPNLRVTWI